MRLGHVPRADAPTSATIVIGRGASTKGYSTKVVTISQGGTLNVVNLDQYEHTVTADANGANGSPLFDNFVEPGHTDTITAASKLAAGTYDFHCRFHNAMVGTLIVEGGSGGIKPVATTFSQPLVLPKVLTGAHLHIAVKRAAVRVLPTGPKTEMWTYGGSYPGPTIVRPAGHDTKVTFTNDLPAAAGAITVHLHGDHHPWQDDGQPNRFLINRGKQRTYDYPLTDNGKPEPAAFDFYHDHRMNETGRNNWRGLQGMFIVKSAKQRSLHLPSGLHDLPLLVSDRSFTAHNQLADPFPATAKPGMSGMTGAQAPPGDGTVGDHILVDGRYAPYLRVSTHRYRLRLLNASNYQSYDFALSDGRPFVQIGTGNALLPHPVVRSDILLGPSQRADVVVDFGGQLGQRIELDSIPRVDHAPSGIGTPTASIMQFRVVRNIKDHTRVPHVLAALPPLRASTTPSKTWTFALGGNSTTGTYWTVNGKAFNPSRVDAEVPLGATRTWRLVNMSPITHFIHLHEEQWHTLLRDGKKPPPWERGLEDTWRLDPGESVVVAARFTDYTGVFMLHCHMLAHEDDGMMAQFAVVKPGTHRLPPGYHLAVAARPTSAGGPTMSMSAGSAEPASSGLPRVVARTGTALLIEAAVLLGVAGVRRYWAIA
jgi:spore coat protein A, manganese oxidase